jgi:hypothetical protein
METLSRQRLVAASQALELEHLQELIRNRELQSQRTEENLLVLLQESRDENDQLNNENTLLRQQLETLRKNVVATDSHDNTINFLRSRVTSLEEERDILLDKIVAERNNSHRVRGLRDSYCQTTDLGSMQCGESVDEIRNSLMLEQSLKRAAEQVVSIHSTNVMTLQQQLQRRIETEVQRLQSEQEAYAHMLHEIHPHEVPVVPTVAKPSLRHQEDEMFNLRKRLNDLQVRHQHSEISEVKAAGVLRHSSVLQRMLQNASQPGR